MERVAIPLVEGFQTDTPYWLNQEAFSLRFRRSPIKRAKRHGMLRNVCIALGNWGDLFVIEPLRLALNDEEPLARAHAAWALGQVRTKHPHHAGVVELLRSVLETESVPWVLEEILEVLNSIK